MNKLKVASQKNPGGWEEKSQLLTVRPGKQGAKGMNSHWGCARGTQLPLPTRAAKFSGIFRKMKNYGQPEETQFFIKWPWF